MKVRTKTSRFLLLTLFLAGFLAAHSQQDTSFTDTRDSIPGTGLAGIASPMHITRNSVSAGITTYHGAFITTDPKAEYVRDSYASFRELFVRFQPRGIRSWQVAHNYPAWGFALIHGNTGSREYIGRMTAVYAFMDLPLLRRSRYVLSLKAGTGPGIVDRPYDIQSNPKNTMIGTKLNVFINAVLNNEFRITDRLFADAGISFMHLSNGGTTLPNLGLNTPGISAGIRYSFTDEAVLSRVRIKDPGFMRERLVRIQSSAGLRQASWVGGNHYLINVLQGETGIRTAPNHYFGAGLQLVWNRSLDYHPSDTPADPGNPEKFQAGIYAAYEHHFGKLSFPFQVGFYFYNRNNYPVIFQQYGARLAITHQWNCFAMLKSHLGKADYIHAGIGYKF